MQMIRKIAAMSDLRKVSIVANRETESRQRQPEESNLIDNQEEQETINNNQPESNQALKMKIKFRRVGHMIFVGDVLLNIKATIRRTSEILECVYAFIRMAD